MRLAGDLQFIYLFIVQFDLIIISQREFRHRRCIGLLTVSMIHHSLPFTKFQMPVSDKFKVAIVAMGYAISLATLWTSPGLRMGNSSMRVLSPPIRQHCKAPQTAANQCQNDCEKIQEAASKCENVVRQAYRYINLGGCPMEIKAWTLCEAEWCERGMDRVACLSECAGVQESLEHCKERVVESYFKQNTLEKDGTMKTY